MDKSEHTSAVSGLTSKSFRKEYGSSRSIPARYLAYNPYSFASKTEIKFYIFSQSVIEYGSSRSMPARYLAYDPYSFVSKPIHILPFRQ